MLGLLAAFCSLLPVVGSALVWAPAALYLIFAGHWVQGLIRAGWSTGVAAVIDNLLRPYIIGGRVQMHPLLIFFSVFGGVEVFGLLGLVMGPLVVAVTMTLLSILRDESRGWGA